MFRFQEHCLFFQQVDGSVQNYFYKETCSDMSKAVTEFSLKVNVLISTFLAEDLHILQAVVWTNKTIRKTHVANDPLQNIYIFT